MIRLSYLPIIISVLLLAGGAFLPHTAFALTKAECDIQIAVNGTDPSSLIDPSCLSASTSVPNPTTPAPTRQGPATGGLDGDGTKVFGWLWGNLMSLFAGLMGYAGVLLNDAVYITVLKMGSFVNDLSAIGVVWRIMRDLSNLILIFGFIAVGVCYILGVKWYGGGTKMIPTLLLAAIFINFSLFVSEAIIDVGNIFAAQFYTQINGGQPPQFLPIFTMQTGQSIGQEGISNVIMGSLGLQTLFNADPNKVNLIGFLSVILFIIAAFVMFSLAFMLIARFVTLIFLIIIAPIGFAGLAVPKLETYAHKWWEALIKNTISAPILLLMLYIALAVITDAKFLSGFGASSSGWTQLANNQGPADVMGFAGILLSFLVAMGLLLACTYLANSMSVTGASFATKWAGKMSFGMVAWGARNTVGWGAQRLSQAARKNRVLRRAPVIGRALTGFLDRGAKASFDVRGGTTGGMLKGLGIDAGEAHKGGYKEAEEAKVKARLEYAKSLRLSPTEEREKKKKEEEKKKNETNLQTLIDVHEENMDKLLIKHRGDLKPFIDAVNAQEGVVRAAEAAFSTTPSAANQTALNTAKADLRLALDSRVARSEEQKKEVDEIASEQSYAQSAQKKSVAQIETEMQNISKRPALAYANILAPTWAPNWFNEKINPARNTEAAKKIREYIAKSKAELSNEALLEAVSKIKIT